MKRTYWVITEHGEVLDISTTKARLPGDLIINNDLVDDLKQQNNIQLYLRDTYNKHVSYEDLKLLTWVIDNYESYPFIEDYREAL